MTDRLKTRLKNIEMSTPIMTASGTSGSCDELEKLRSKDQLLASIGAFVTKGVSLRPRKGNLPVRVYPTRSGLLNSIGLQNKGVDGFVSQELPLLQNYQLPIIVNISANTVEEFATLTASLLDGDKNGIIRGIEINVSCPNIKEGGALFGTNPTLVEKVVRSVKKNVDDKLLVITKMTPNVTNITEPARAAINSGTDALSMINTLRGLAIDIENERPLLANTYGGLSGPAIKPIGLAKVYESFSNIKECRDKRIPIIGVGGISNARDALEYFMAGATAIAVGTAWLVDNNVIAEIKEGLDAFINQHDKYDSIGALVGVAHDK